MSKPDLKDRKVFNSDYRPLYPDGLPDDFKAYKDERGEKGEHVPTADFLRMMASNAAMKRVEQLIEELTSYANSDNEAEIYAGIARQLNRTHRTIQQNFMKFMLLAAIEFFAYQNEQGYTDLRNEASCKFAAKIKEMAENPDNFLPYH